MKRRTLQRTVGASVFTALIALFAQISIPMPIGVPITLQIFAVALCGFYLGFSGIGSVAVYLLLGACGAPVFAAFGGGISKLVGITGGFLWGFLPMAALCAVPVKKRRFAVFIGLAGLALCHTAGVLQFSMVTHTPIWAAFLRTSAPYLPKDAVSVFLAKVLAERLRKIKKL